MAREEGFIGRLIRPFVSDTALSLLSLVMLVGIGIGTYSLWRKYGPTLTKTPAKALSLDDLEISRQPRWIRTDVKTDTMTRWSLDHRNVFEPELPSDVGHAFEAHPWVKRVTFAGLRYPSSMVVELTYRRPVAFVDVPGGILAKYPDGGLLPIDDEGYHLPIEDFTAPINESDHPPESAERHLLDEYAEFPVVRAGDTFPRDTQVGTAWGDARIVGAARIANFLGEHWSDIQLDWIETPGGRTRPPSLADSSAYVIYARNGLPIIWGRPPGEEKVGETHAERKLERLMAIVAQRGPLDVADQFTSDQVIDLRVEEAAKTASRQR